MREYRPILAVDFDGTITKHNDFPECGELMPGAREVLQELHALGCYIILWTCRSGEALKKAVRYCDEKQIPIDFVNEDCPRITESFKNKSHKVFANYYIDDLNLGGFPGWDYVRAIVKRDPFFSPRT